MLSVWLILCWCGLCLLCVVYFNMCTCVFRLECVLCVYELIWVVHLHAVMAAFVWVCVRVCACVCEGKGREGGSPGKIIKVNGSQMDCFSSFLSVVNDVRRVTSLKWETDLHAPALNPGSNTEWQSAKLLSSSGQSCSPPNNNNSINSVRLRSAHKTG